eukprot:2674037-Rhodomonas_salina.3
MERRGMLCKSFVGAYPTLSSSTGGAARISPPQTCPGTPRTAKHPRRRRGQGGTGAEESDVNTGHEVQKTCRSFSSVQAAPASAM